MNSLRYPTRLAARTQTAAAPVVAPVVAVAPAAPAVAPTDPAPVVAVTPAAPVVAPSVAPVVAPTDPAPARKRYLTRLAFARLRARMDGHAQRAWDADGPRVLYIIRAVTRRLTALMVDLRRAYRTKPYSWIAETFDSRLKVFRDQAKWIGDQLLPHEIAVKGSPEYHELIVALQSCVVLIEKVRSKA